jgi:hypothetical protein
MAKPLFDLNDYDDEKDLKYDNRGMYINPDGSVRGVIYMWLSDERREWNDTYAKRYYPDDWSYRYCPFNEGDKVTKLMTSRDIRMTGKITYIERDYYGGDCLVLYVDFDKPSSKRWIKFKESLNAL